MRAPQDIIQEHANALAEFGRLTMMRDELPALIEAQRDRIRRLVAEHDAAVAKTPITQEPTP